MHVGCTHVAYVGAARGLHGHSEVQLHGCTARVLARTAGKGAGQPGLKGTPLTRHRR